MMSTPSIEILKLSKHFGAKPAVSDLNLRINAGELFCLLGPNGAGKSTTISTIMGLKAPTSGDVRINGVSIMSPEIQRVRRHVGYVPEHPVFYDFLTGREFVQFIAELYQVPADRMSDIDASFARFGLESDADALIKTYSMGMKKKIAIIASLIYDPQILIMDEPTGALDAWSARALKDILVAARDDGKLVLFTTHVMEIAERIADRIAIIHEGKLITQGSLAELRALHGSPGDSLEDIFLRLTVATPRRANAVAK